MVGTTSTSSPSSEIELGTTWKSSLPVVVFGEIALVPPQKCGHIVRHDVNLAADGQRFPGINASKAEVGMDASGHALKQFLVRLPGGGEDQPFVGAEATDQSIIGLQFA